MLAVPDALQREGRPPLIQIAVNQKLSGPLERVPALVGTSAATVIEVGSIVWSASIVLAQHILDSALDLRRLWYARTLLSLLTRLHPGASAQLLSASTLL